MVNNAMIALTHEDPQQPNTPLSVCVAMSQAYIGYDLQNALREELLNRGIEDIPVATMITQLGVGTRRIRRSRRLPNPSGAFSQRSRLI